MPWGVIFLIFILGNWKLQLYELSRKKITAEGLEAIQWRTTELALHRADL